MPFQARDFLWLVERQRAAESGRHLPIPGRILDIIRERWRDLADAHARLDPDRQLEPASEFPGYLTTTCGQWQIFVPWSLAKFFPGRTLISELIEIGAGLAVPPPHTICISGSAAALGSEIEIGDIDFCQYVSQPPSSIFKTAAIFRTYNMDIDNRVLVAASYGSDQAYVKAHVPEWDEWPRLQQAMTLATTICRADRFLAEFLHDQTRFGLLPVSVVILATDLTNRMRGASKHSYIYQEAIAVSLGEAVPRPAWSLVDTHQLADYIEFLFDQMNDYYEAKPIKALKRALSLSNTIRLESWGVAANQILESGEAADYIKDKRKREVDDWSRQLNGPDTIVVSGHSEAKHYDKKERDYTVLEDKAREVVSGIKREIQYIRAALRSELGVAST